MSTVTARPPSIAVIMPAFNEAARIDRTIATIATYRAGSGSNVRAVFVADDGSTDETVAVARAAAAREGMAIEVLSFPHRGKALTVRSAMLDVSERSDADYLMMLDADDELRIDQLDHVVWSPDPRAVYIGKRDEGSERGSAKPTPVRRLMSLAMRSASRLLLGLPYRDTQCGFKLFRRATVEPILRRVATEGFAFDVELLARAERAGLRVTEVGVEWSDAKGTKLRLFPDAWHMAVDLLRIRRRLAAEHALS